MPRNKTRCTVQTTHMDLCIFRETLLYSRQFSEHRIHKYHLYGVCMCVYIWCASLILNRGYANAQTHTQSHTAVSDEHVQNTFQQNTSLQAKSVWWLCCVVFLSWVCIYVDAKWRDDSRQPPMTRQPHHIVRRLSYIATGGLRGGIRAARPWRSCRRHQQRFIITICAVMAGVRWKHARKNYVLSVGNNNHLFLGLWRMRRRL